MSFSFFLCSFLFFYRFRFLVLFFVLSLRAYLSSTTFCSWSAAGAFGPILITTIRNQGVHDAHGGSLVDIYNPTLYIMCGLLALGFILTLLIHPLVHPEDDDEVVDENEDFLHLKEGFTDEGTPLFKSDPDKLRYV